MNVHLLLLTAIMLCMATPHSDQSTPAAELGAAVTDMPDIIDMSHADPKTWHSLPAAQPPVPARQEYAALRHAYELGETLIAGYPQ
jgi:hypothetical protein